MNSNRIFRAQEPKPQPVLRRQQLWCQYCGKRFTDRKELIEHLEGREAARIRQISEVVFAAGCQDQPLAIFRNVSGAGRPAMEIPAIRRRPASA